jgi:disulfide bond formation protein DsbB
MSWLYGLKRVVENKWYWLALLALGLSMEAVALLYQHGFKEDPCVLCIQVRLWVLCLIVVALLALAVRRAWFYRLAQLLTIVIFAGLLERSWQLFGTERGFLYGDCGFDLGLPAWLALDEWFPAVFRVETSCGYTPELLFGITMAEALLVMSGVLLLAALVIMAASFARHAD